MKAYTFALPIAMLILNSCGEPKYHNRFSEWITLKVAEQSPVKITDVDVEETAVGETETVFQFKASGETSEDLYKVDPIVDTKYMQKMNDRVSGVNSAAATDSGLESAIIELAQFKSNNTGILTVETPKGTKISISGKAKALKGIDGEWTFQTINVEQLSLPGTPKPKTGVFKVAGTDAAIAAIKTYKELTTKMEKTLVLAEAIRMEQMRVETEAFIKREETEKASKEKALNDMLARISDGTTYQATWKSNNARGNLTLTFGKGTKFPKSYSADATLSSPDFPKMKKAISANLIGDGSSEKPYSVELVVIREPANPDNMIPESESYYSFRSDSRGFIARDCEYNLELIPDKDSKTFTTQTTASGRIGPNGEISISWTMQVN